VARESGNKRGMGKGEKKKRRKEREGKEWKGIYTPRKFSKVGAHVCIIYHF